MDVLYNQRTTYPNPAAHKVSWYLIDLNGLPLGRVASYIAHRLQGKHLPDYQPSVFQADAFVLINAKQVFVSGNKRTQKKYIWHTGYMGGLKSRTFEEQIEKNPEKIILQAIKGMMPKNKLSNRVLKSVRVFPKEQHTLQAQQPELLSLSF